MLLSSQETEPMAFSIVIRAFLLIVCREFDENSRENRTTNLVWNQGNIFCSLSIWSGKADATNAMIFMIKRYPACRQSIRTFAVLSYQTGRKGRWRLLIHDRKPRALQCYGLSRSNSAQILIMGVFLLRFHWRNSQSNCTRKLPDDLRRSEYPIRHSPSS
jgi:hypothetical protein